MTYKFELIPQSWFKRRAPGDEKKVADFSVESFKLEENHRCQVTVFYGDEACVLNAKVMRSCTYLNDGSEVNIRWSIQGLNSEGVSIILRVTEC